MKSIIFNKEDLTKKSQKDVKDFIAGKTSECPDLIMKKGKVVFEHENPKSLKKKFLKK